MSEPNYKAGYERLLRSMEGIASCGTHCPGCQMLARIARNAVAEAPLALDVPAGTPPAGDSKLLTIPDFLRKGDD